MSLRTLVLLPVLVASPEPAFFAAPGGAAEALFQQARDLRFAQHWYDAAACYRKLLADYPDSSRAPDASFWLASCLEQDQRWDEAAAAYTAFLTRYPDQRLLGREAKLNRIRCWGIRQWNSVAAQEGLVEALGDPLAEVRTAAALQLARRKDPRAVPVLQAGLQSDASFDACRLALLAMGVQPQAANPSQGRFLVVRIREKGQKDTVTIRVALGLARAVSGYLSDAQLKEAHARGIHMDRLMEQALDVPKGTELFSLNDGKSTVAVTVE